MSLTLGQTRIRRCGTDRSGRCSKKSVPALRRTSARFMDSTPFRLRYPRLASFDLTTIVTRLMPAPLSADCFAIACRPTDGRYPRNRSDRRSGSCGGHLRQSAVSRRSFRWRRSQHPRRHRASPPPLTITPPDALRLNCEPAANCDQYDSLRGKTDEALRSPRGVAPQACLRHDGES